MAPPKPPAGHQRGTFEKEHRQDREGLPAEHAEGSGRQGTGRLELAHRTGRRAKVTADRSGVGPRGPPRHRAQLLAQGGSDVGPMDCPEGAPMEADRPGRRRGSTEHENADEEHASSLPPRQPPVATGISKYWPGVHQEPRSRATAPIGWWTVAGAGWPGPPRPRQDRRPRRRAQRFRGSGRCLPRSCRPTGRDSQDR
jgi:hypothetical protein